MRDFDPETFEADLSSLKPARMPEELSTDLARSLAVRRSESPVTAVTAGLAAGAIGTRGPNLASRVLRAAVAAASSAALALQPRQNALLRWAIPVAGLVGLMGLFIFCWRGTPSNKPKQTASKSTPVAILKPDAVLLSQELVANFEAVTRLPDGSPVRVRCEEWIDEVQLRDPVRGVWVEHRKPRLEIHPVGYEIY